MQTYKIDGTMTGYETGRALKGGPLKFTVKSPQLIHDGWRNTDRWCRYFGECAICGTTTYAFDDGENDPRGMLGDHAADTFALADHLCDEDAAEVRRVKLRDIPACFGCTNDYDRYKMLLAMGTRKARAKGANI